MSEYLFTSESVTEGHPDKLCDQVSDAILDALLKDDKGSRVACETLTKTGFVLVAGEITTTARSTSRRSCAAWSRTSASPLRHGLRLEDLRHHGRGRAAVARHRAGRRPRRYTREAGRRRSGPDVRLRVRRDHGADAAADPDGAPAREAARRGSQEGRRSTACAPTARRQVSVRYEGRPATGIEAIVVSTQHSDDVKQKTLEEAIREQVIKPILPAKLVTNKTKIHINPTGRFVIGGPMGDSGLTGRKIIVDTYGGMGRHGGGAFSGKDPSKVDRSAAYYARYIAKHVVAAGLARRCEVQFAYAIGVAEPVSMLVDTFGTGTVRRGRLTEAVLATFDAARAC